ncbi:uncharacterized protein LOC128036125 [Gossypium raimondii]|uniref:uncharacterized protein LOC128036125 n=1 Tax=Gossypium raimondii TaxID=29730 RepID=UPI00227B7B55|nr:uncharacterized protein LOC128036125 [Gossypium raimondii]
MVREGIVLGHKISQQGIEVDKEKIEVIEKLLPSTSAKGIRSFLGRAGFYRRVIKDCSKISKPLCTLLEKNRPFNFDEPCLIIFEELKKRLVATSIVIVLEWTLSFELMSDTSDFAMGAVLGQQKDKIIKKCVLDEEMHNILQHCHSVPYGGYFGGMRNAAKRIDFMGPFPLSLGNLYILLAVDYDSKWVESVALLANNSKSVMKFLHKNIFTTFGKPRAIINDEGSHFDCKLVANSLQRYRVKHKISTKQNNLIETHQLRLAADLAKLQEKLALYWANTERRDAAMRRSLQKNFTKPMLACPDFPKELQAAIVEKVGEVKPAETDPSTTKKENKELEEEIEKIESDSIATDREEEKEVNPTLVPLVNNIVVVPPSSTEPMIE